MKIAPSEQTGTFILCLSFIIAAGDKLGDDIHVFRKGIKNKRERARLFPFLALSFSLGLI
jgi:hypothetical protein